MKKNIVLAWLYSILSILFVIVVILNSMGRKELTASNHQLRASNQQLFQANDYLFKAYMESMSSEANAIRTFQAQLHSDQWYLRQEQESFQAKCSTPEGCANFIPEFEKELNRRLAQREEAYIARVKELGANFEQFEEGLAKVRQP